MVKINPIALYLLLSLLENVEVDAFDVTLLKFTLDSNNIVLNDFFQKRQDQINRITTASEIAKRTESFILRSKDFIIVIKHSSYINDA